MPAMLASTSLMVPEEQLTRFQGLNQGLQGVINIAAPLLGALLIEFLPLHIVLAVDLGTAALAILPLIFISIPQPKVDPSQAEVKTTVWKDMRLGFRYVWGWAGLRNIIFLAVLINMILVPAITLMPLMVKDEFSGGALQIASMQSALAVGFLIGGLLLSVWGGFRRKILTSNLAMFGTALGLLLVGVSHNVAFQLALAGIFIVGMMNVLLNGPAFALLQTVVEADIQGRVMSLVMSLTSAMTPIGLLIAGPVAEQIGVNPMFIIASLVFVGSGIFTLFNSNMQNLEQRRGENILEQDSALAAAASTD